MRLPERDRRLGVGTKGGGDLVGDAVTNEHTADAINAAVAMSLRARGCTCEVIVTGVTVNGIRHLHIMHDAWCPAVDGAA